MTFTVSTPSGKVIYRPGHLTPTELRYAYRSLNSVGRRGIIGISLLDEIYPTIMSNMRRAWNLKNPNLFKGI
jgi:hypothetical protein